MSVPLILYVIALVLGLIEVFRARGDSLVGWGVVALAVGLLWGNFT
jgi:hypothetical protein